MGAGRTAGAGINVTLTHEDAQKALRVDSA